MSKISEKNKKIENVVIGCYQKIEDKVVGSYQKIEDKFVDTFLKHDNETIDEAKIRLHNEQAERENNKKEG